MKTHQIIATNWLLIIAPSFLLGATPVEPDGQGNSAKAWSEAHIEDLGKLYRHLHTHPEMSFRERKTAARLAQEWKAIGAHVTQKVGGHGVVAVIENGDGPTIMLRCDMDALPVTEMTNLVYASKARGTNQLGDEVGVMHACGHDIHMTNLVGVSQFLAANKKLWRGRLILLAQPAEERGAGAVAMLKDGLFERFGKPDYAVALHVDSTLAAGKIRFRPGYALANVDSMDITMRGKGGHGAYPHATVDPVVQAAELVMSLQTIVSREIGPTQPAVITVGSIHGGTKHNIIGNDCHLQLTLRSYSPIVRQHLQDALRRKAKAIAVGARAPEPIFKVSEGSPSLKNDDTLVSRLGPVFRQAVGEENVSIAEPVMGGEDFARYGEAGVPIMMFWLGTIEEARLRRFHQLGIAPPSLHSAEFYPDYEPTLITGITAMVSATLELLAP